MRWVLIVAGVVIGVPVLLALAGMLLPRGHVAVRSVKLKAGPDAVWALVSDLAGVPAWWPYLSKVERLADRNGREVWKETRANRWSIPLETMESIPGRRLVRRIADEDLAFGGEWVYEIEPSEGGSLVTVTERGEVKKPVLRVFTLFGKKRAGIDSYLKALARRLGEEVHFGG
ncbi:MAG: SRPBCC family protein [Phycisphaerales bacterium]|nr:SRPBCC family protein [Phycisphaerales bacterium]